MKKITRYISKQITFSIFAVLLIILGLDALSSIVDQVESIKGDLTFYHVLYITLLDLPSRLVEYMPYAALIGCLVGIGLLSNNSEIVVLRSAGLSIWRLLSISFIPVLVLMGIAMAVSEFAVPHLNQYIENKRDELRYSGKKNYLSSQLWNREGREFMRVYRLMFDGNIKGLERYEFDEEWRLIKAQTAATAVYENGVWTLGGVRETYFNLSQPEKLTRKSYKEQVWDTQLEPKMLQYLVVEPDDLSIRRLSGFIDYLEEQSLNTEQYQLSFWQKLFYPLTALSLILVAISGVFGSLRQVSIGARIFSGILIGVFFRMFQNLLTPIALVYDLSPLLASLVPIAICLLIGFWRVTKT